MEGSRLLLDFNYRIGTTTLYLLAQNLLAQGDAAAPASGVEQFFNSPLPLMVGMAVLFILIFIRPEQKRKAQEAKLMASLKKNDRIVTIGGIHGTIVSAAPESDVVTIKIDEAGNTRVKINRSAVARIVQDSAAAKESGSNNNSES
jgi:preprotein translocase subunit YajC